MEGGTRRLRPTENNDRDRGGRTGFLLGGSVGYPVKSTQIKVVYIYIYYTVVRKHTYLDHPMGVLLDCPSLLSGISSDIVHCTRWMVQVSYSWLNQQMLKNPSSVGYPRFSGSYLRALNLSWKINTVALHRPRPSFTTLLHRPRYPNMAKRGAAPGVGSKRPSQSLFLAQRRPKS